MSPTSYPSFGKNLHLQEFYNKKEKEFVNKKVHSTSFHFKDIMLFFLLFVFSVSTFTIAYLTKYGNDIRSNASEIEKRATIFLYPTDLKVETNSQFVISPKIVVLQEKKVSSVLLSIRFDNKLIKLNQTMPYDEKLTHMKILKTSDIPEANQTGIFKVFIGSVDSNNPPFKVVSMPQISFTRLEAGSTPIVVDKNESRTTYVNQEEGVVESGSTITVN
jgi:hypothetical protein